MIARSRWKASSRKVPSPVRKARKLPSLVIIWAFSSSAEILSAPIRFICFTMTLACSLITKTTSAWLAPWTGMILWVTSARKKPFSTYFSWIFLTFRRTESRSRIWYGFRSITSLKSSLLSSSFPCSRHWRMDGRSTIRTT